MMSFTRINSRKLNDELYYSSIPNSNQKEIFAKLKELINQNETITDHKADVVLNFDCNTSTFYGLPKIHKSQINILR